MGIDAHLTWRITSIVLLMIILLLHTAISYTVHVTTADQSDAGTKAKVYVVLIGAQAASEKLDLELVQKSGFEPGTAETFSVEADDVGDVKKIEVGKFRGNYEFIFNITNELV